MRPCGPGRNYWRPTREVTKKEVLDMLQNHSYATIEMYENEIYVSEYTRPVSKLKALIRKSDTSVHSTTSYSFSKFKKEGFKSIIVKIYDSSQIIIVRQAI